jgi:hypothetical protein
MKQTIHISLKLALVFQVFFLNLFNKTKEKESITFRLFINY